MPVCKVTVSEQALNSKSVNQRDETHIELSSRSNYQNWCAVSSCQGSEIRKSHRRYRKELYQYYHAVNQNGRYDHLRRGRQGYAAILVIDRLWDKDSSPYNRTYAGFVPALCNACGQWMVTDRIALQE